MSTEQPTVPTCIGMIMDGNRRFATERGVSTIEGHTAGYEKLKEVAQWCRDSSIHHLVVYAFSTENWNRSDEEVSYLMRLMRTFLKEQKRSIQKDGVAVHIVGDLSRFPDDIQVLVQKLHDTNPTDAVDHVWIAASYGGRVELVAAANALAAQGTGPYTEDEFAAQLTTAGMPDPDIIVRTGGQKRLSNFLPWQSVYSELFFLDTYWPAFSKEEFMQVLSDYSERLRNFGK